MSTLPLLIVGAVGLVVAGCGDNVTSRRDGMMTPIRDLNPADGVVEASLVAGPGQKRYLPDGPATVWGYRDGSVEGSPVTVPGPLIEAKLGDRVIVHFRNELSEATTIHWHGVRVPNDADGTLATQLEIPSGGTFDYEFTAVDAGTFWYHPHMHGDVQIERGLYGMLVVTDTTDAALDLAVSTERRFILDDVKLEATGELSATTDSLDVMLGRQGNVLLANGVSTPRFETDDGARERWRFVNAANGRYFNLRLPGHTFRVIGWDGGLLPEPYEVETLLITPGERYDVIVELKGALGSELALETVHYDRGHRVPDRGPQAILKLAFVGRAPAVPALVVPPVSPPGLTVDDLTPSERLVLSEDEGAPGQDPQFFINDQRFPDGVSLQGSEDEVAVWTVHNDSEMDHPFHLHGMLFSVLDVDGIVPAHAGWKDTVNVPQQSTLRFAVRYGSPGEWMFHCHILEHAERGMMSSIHIAAPP